ncbi:MAG: FAD-dependent oxidoreductase [Saccharofermentanales bacterium]|mgnify:CR=1 FL=1|jgi:fumarate reductase flavoprotein subunit
MKQMECDVVVIAAGPAGLAAAVSAAERDAQVIILEKANTTGGASNMGMGPLGVETRIQRESLIGLTREEAFQKFMDYTHWRVDARLVREYLYKSADTIEWLEEMGVEFFGAYRYFPESEATWHIVKPESGEMGPRAASSMMRILTERAQELGAEVLLETPAKKIIKEDGRITGVVATDKSGEEIHISCNAVVVATGGFGDNPEMIKQFTPYEYGKSMFNFRIPGVVGDGMKMAWEVGAARTECNMEVAYGCPVGDAYPTVKGVHQQPNLMVNLDGERFVNEEVMSNTTYFSNALFTQKKSVGFSIFDDSILNYYAKNGVDKYNLVFHITSLDSYKSEMEQAVQTDPGFFFMADSIEELAEKMGVNKEGLVATVAEYNEACKSRDVLFNKDARYLKPLKGPRFYAIAFYPGAYGSLGGIKINYKTEVLDEEWNKIPGLYAAGTDANTIFGDSYVFILPGNTMGFALNSGRMAGENAVEYLIDLYSQDEE